MEEEFVPFTISAVAQNIPANSSIQFELLGNFNYMETTSSGKRGVNNWNRSAYITYVQLNPGSGLASDAQKLVAFRHKYYPKEEEELKKEGFKWEGNAPPVRYGLQSLKAGHTDTKIFGGAIENVDPKTIWILLSIAGGVLLIACINFTTLAIGRSARRAKEVGVRKVIGGERRQLVWQFLSEAVILSMLSAALGLLLAQNGYCPISMTFRDVNYNSPFRYILKSFGCLAVSTLLVGLLAGSYPAFNTLRI